MAENPSTHTNRVKILRRLLIGAALLAALALVGLSNLDRFGGQSALLTALRATGPAIDNPDYQGRTANGRAYRLTGAAAQADENDDTVLRLPVFELAALADAPAVIIKADEARLRHGQEAVMQGNVKMEMSDANRLHTQKLIARIETDTVSVPQELTITGPEIDMRADSMTGNLDSQIFTLENISMTLSKIDKRQGR